MTAPDRSPDFEEIFALDAEGGDAWLSRVHAHGYGRIFGGLVLGQALMAAYRTLEGRVCHSIHAHFLRTGDLASPVRYVVERVRDGGTFSTRRVVAMQHDAPILHLAASFQAPEQGCAHSAPALPAVQSRSAPATGLNSVGPPASISAMIEIAPASSAGAGQLATWLRAARPVADEIALQQAALAYASDIAFMEAAMRPHGLSFATAGFQGASLDHAVWFHHPPDMNAWTLFDQESPSASGGRGFVRGQLFDASGRLVASVAQECLMRLRR